MTDNMEIWNSLNRPPKSALKTIKGGRLSGMTDISPQWRYQAMTEQFGPIGEGWRYEIVKMWSEPGSEGQIFAFAEIKLYWYIESDTEANKWSDAIPGIGGSMLIATEKKGKPEEYLYSSDEAYKMAVTDALSVAMKALGVAADIYAGLWDGSKYRDPPKAQKSEPPMTKKQLEEIAEMCKLKEITTEKDKKAVRTKYGITKKTTEKQAKEIIVKMNKDFAEPADALPERMSPDEYRNET